MLPPQDCPLFLSASHKQTALSIFVGRGQCLRSKLATERSGVCLHPAARLFALTQRLPPGGSWRGATEGACVTLKSCYPHFCALSPTRFHREPPPGGSLWKGAPPYCWFSPFVFYGASRTSPPTMNGGIRCSAILFVRAICFQTGDSIFRLASWHTCFASM